VRKGFREGWKCCK